MGLKRMNSRMIELELVPSLLGSLRFLGYPRSRRIGVEWQFGRLPSRRLVGSCESLERRMKRIRDLGSRLWRGGVHARHIGCWCSRVPPTQEPDGQHSNIGTPLYSNSSDAHQILELSSGLLNHAILSLEDNTHSRQIPDLGLTNDKRVWSHQQWYFSPVPFMRMELTNVETPSCEDTRDSRQDSRLVLHQTIQSMSDVSASSSVIGLHRETW